MADRAHQERQQDGGGTARKLSRSGYLAPATVPSWIATLAALASTAKRPTNTGALVVSLPVGGLVASGEGASDYMIEAEICVTECETNCDTIGDMQLNNMSVFN
jgi:hypothetical protein